MTSSGCAVPPETTFVDDYADLAWKAHLAGMLLKGDQEGRAGELIDLGGDACKTGHRRALLRQDRRA